MTKRTKKFGFKFKHEETLPLIRPMGGCYVSDRITVDGEPVGEMVRDAPERETESGWSFFAGDESQAYLNDANNVGFFDVNTIANHDPSIIPYLYALPGQRFYRDGKTGCLVEARNSKPNLAAAGLPKGIQVVQGRVQLALGWAMTLGSPFRRRKEKGSHVLWRPRLTFWIAIGEKMRGTIDARAAKIRAGISPDAYDVKAETNNGLARLTYRLVEDPEGMTAPSLYSAIVSSTGDIRIAAYFDDETELVAAREAIGSVRQES